MYCNDSEYIKYNIYIYSYDLFVSEFRNPINYDKTESDITIIQKKCKRSYLNIGKTNITNQFDHFGKAFKYINNFNKKYFITSLQKLGYLLSYNEMIIVANYFDNKPYLEYINIYLVFFHGVLILFMELMK